MKTAYITMDVESFYDTTCLKKYRISPDEKYDCAEEVGRFLDFLDKEQIKATFFINVEFAERCKDFLLRAKQSGHELALHSLKHVSPTEQGKEEFERDLDEAKKRLFDILGVEVKGYRAPCFGLSDEKFDAVKSRFEYDSSALNFKEAKGSDNLNLDGFEKINEALYEKDAFFEYPVLKNKMLGKKVPICGGGYVRIAPWFLMKRSIFHWIKNSDAYMLYVHPFEISQKKLPMPKELKSYEKYFLNKGRMDYLNKIALIVKELKDNRYVFKTMNPAGIEDE